MLTNKSYQNDNQPSKMEWFFIVESLHNQLQKYLQINASKAFTIHLSHFTGTGIALAILYQTHSMNRITTHKRQPIKPFTILIIAYTLVAIIGIFLRIAQ